MADRIRYEDLTAPELAALDVWQKVSADTTGMLYAVRAAIAQVDRSEDARLAIAEKALHDAGEAILGSVENGPWHLITDPNLRQVVGEYVADTCHTIANAAGLPDVAEKVHNVMPTRLATGGLLVDGDARQRLARHLYVTRLGATLRRSGEEEWDSGTAKPEDVQNCYERADALLAVITGKEN